MPGEVAKKKILIGRLVVSFVRHAGPDHAQTDQGFLPVICG